MRTDPDLVQPLTGYLPYVGAQVVWAVRQEMARMVEGLVGMPGSIFVKLSEVSELVLPLPRDRRDWHVK